MKNNILEHEKLVTERINKSFGVESNSINKAIDSSLESSDDSLDELKKAHNIGDEKVYQGITYYVSGFNSKHIPLWRKKKGQTSGSLNSNIKKKEEVKETKEEKDDIKDNSKENDEEKKDEKKFSAFKKEYGAKESSLGDKTVLSFPSSESFNRAREDFTKNNYYGKDILTFNSMDNEIVFREKIKKDIKKKVSEVQKEMDALWNKEDSKGYLEGYKKFGNIDDFHYDENTKKLYLYATNKDYSSFGTPDEITNITKKDFDDYDKTSGWCNINYRGKREPFCTNEHGAISIYKMLKEKGVDVDKNKIKLITHFD
jgi:hypothetical protein